MASLFYVSVKPKMSIEEEGRKCKMCKDSWLSDLVFEKERFSHY